MLSSIYLITNRVNQKKYIGFTSRDPQKRWEEHLYRSRRAGSQPIYKALRKYSLTDFKFTVIYQSWNFNHCLNVMEKYFITKYDSHTSRWGYNVTTGGDENTSGYTMSNETKIKMSISHKQSRKRGIHHGNYGRKHTDATKSKMRDKKLGKKLSEDHKDKIREGVLTNRNLYLQI